MQRVDLMLVVKLALKRGRATNFGNASVLVTVRGDAPGDPSIPDLKASLGGLQVGKIGSAGNVTYGGKAGNFNYGVYQVDNSGAGLGYSLDVGFGTSIGVSAIAPTGGNKMIPDVDAAITLSQGWGSIKVGGGAIFHVSEGTKYDTTHADYMALTAAQVEALDDPADLSGLGFYAGGGADIPIPGLSSTTFGATGFFFSGALSKMGNIPSLDVYKRAPCVTEGTSTTCTNAMTAGRPLYKEGVMPAMAAHSATDPAGTVATAAAVKADGFDPKDIQTETLFATDYSVGAPDSPAAGEGHIQEIKTNSGFSANGGLKHSFSSDIGIAVNGGFYSASEGDYSATGFMAGGSFDYSPVAGMTFTIGGEFASASVAHGGEEADPVKKQFDEDAQAFDPSFAATVQISQSF